MSTPLLEKYVSDYEKNPKAALTAYMLYRELADREPPGAKSLADLGTFLVRFSAREPFKPESADALLAEFREALPEGVEARDFNTWPQAGNLVGMAVVDGVARQQAVLEALKRSKRLMPVDLPLPMPRALRNIFYSDNRLPFL